MSSSHSAPRPEGMHVLTPHLVCKGALEAIEFYKQAFDATELFPPMDDGNGKIIHSAIQVCGSSVMIMDEFLDYGGISPQTLKGTPVTIHLFVEDVDSFVAKAVDVGAKVVMPVEDQFWGDRYGVIEDPFGHSWSIATHRRSLSPEEIREAMLKSGG